MGSRKVTHPSTDQQASSSLLGRRKGPAAASSLFFGSADAAAAAPKGNPYPDFSLHETDEKQSKPDLGHKNEDEVREDGNVDDDYDLDIEGDDYDDAEDEIKEEP